MSEEADTKQEIEIKKKKINIRAIIVFFVLTITFFITFISNRAEYLKVKEIGENYTSIFFKNFYMKTGMFIISFLFVYILFYINNKIIKKGMKHFFEEESRNIPKLPNKSISLIFALIAGFFSLKFFNVRPVPKAPPSSDPPESGSGEGGRGL